MTSPGDDSSGSRANMLSHASNFTISGGQFLAAGRDLYVNSSAPDTKVTKAEILQWLKAPDVATNFLTARDKIQQGTGLWLLADTRFADWKENKKTLWIQGKAGSSKTFICTSVIQEIWKESTSNQAVMLLFHYFDSRAESKQTFRGLLLSLIAHITQYSPEVHPGLVNLFKQGRNSAIQEPSIGDLQYILHILSEAWKTHGTTYIVMDAFDECKNEDQPKVMEFVQKMHTANSAHILITCQYLSPSWDNIVVISLQTRDVNHDISNYLDTGVKNLTAVQGHADLEVEVKEYLLAGADGVFRWIECQLTTLRECGTQEALRQALKALPKTLELTYSEQLSRISSFHKHDAKLLLQWLTFSFKPLSVLQCQEILTVDLAEQTFNLKRRENLLQQKLRNIVGSVLIIISPEQIVQLAHHSVKEFLSCNYNMKPPEFFMINEQLAHHVIAETCLIYMQHYFTIYNVPSTTTWPLADYSIRYWLQHRQNVQSIGSTLANLCIQVFQDPIWDKWLLNSKYRYEIVKHSHQPMIFAAFYGLEEIVKHFLASGVKVNTKGGIYGNALQAAADGGHESVVKLLLALGADVNAQGDYYGNALQAAAEGNEAVMKLLLASGADVNAQSGYCGNALQAAATEGNESVVKLLLASKAEVNAQGGHYKNALQVAAAKGHESVVKLLLASGADINAQSGFLRALQAAAAKGYESVVKLLLASGAEVNAQGGHYENALQVAAAKGHESVIKLFLASGADANAQGGYYGNALQAAAAEGNEAVVKLLLASGAEVNAQSGYYGNALQAAANKGHESMVKLFLASGAEVNAQGGYYGNSLQPAAAEGHESVVKLLLASGADVNAQGGYYGNALQAAAAESHESVVKLLLASDAEFNAQSGYYGNALQAAAGREHESVVKLLLASGAEVNAQSGYYGNALQAAAGRGHESVVKLLLASGAKVNAKGGKYGYALQAAAAEGHDSVVKLLLASGAEVNAQSGHYGNALQAAALEGHESVAKLLLASGAEVNAQSSYYGNALQAAAAKGHESVAKLLLASGADVNFTDGLYGTALQAAAYWGHKSIVKLLLASGADVNVKGGRYRLGTALQIAKRCGHDSVVQLLLESGAHGRFRRVLGQLLSRPKT